MIRRVYSLRATNTGRRQYPHECPATVTIKNYIELYDDPELKRDFEDSRSKENITCIYRSCTYISSVCDDLIMQRLFPHEWITAKNTRLEEEKEQHKINILMEKQQWHGIVEIIEEEEGYL